MGGPRTGIGHVVEQPPQFGARKIGVYDQAGPFADRFLQTACAQSGAGGFRPAVLPDDGVVNGNAGLSVPHHRGLALVGNADAADLVCAHTRFGQSLLCRSELNPPDLHGVMLDPARARVHLRQLTLSHRHGDSASVKQDAAGAGSALVQGK